jgi:DNA-directed RNA polymerase subunit RPC12/RpoP
LRIKVFGDILMKCFRCGTEYFGIECPTCAQKRLSEERNRLLQEQNRKLEQQTRELERQNQLMEQQKWERDNEISQQKNDEAFEARLEELTQYADERNLKPVMVCCDITEAMDEGSEFFGPVDDTFESYGDIIECIEPLREKCLFRFNKLVEAFDADDRVIETVKYGKCFTPEFKLGNLKQVLNSHTSDYVIMLSQSEQLTIFPLRMIGSDINGYSGKNIKIGEFHYLMFLKDNKEVNEVAQILSESSRCFDSAIKKIKETASEYMAANPKPKFEPESTENSKIGKIAGAFFAIIASVISIFLAVKLLYAFADLDIEYLFFRILEMGFIGVLVDVVCAALVFIVFFKICNSIKESILASKRTAKWKGNKKREEKTNKAIIEWKNQLVKTIEGYINGLQFDRKTGEAPIAIQ